MILMSYTIAIIQAPNAMEPKWYLNIHFTPVKTEPFPPVSLVWEKYQTHAAAAIMNCAHPIIKAFTQRRPNKW